MTLKKILPNISWLILIQGFTQFLPLITMPYLIKQLGMEAFGKYSFISSFGLYIITIINYGFDLSGPTYLQKSNSLIIKSNLVNNVLYSKLLLFIISVFFGLIFIYFLPNFKKSERIYFVIPYLQGFFSIILFDWFFLGVNNFKNYAYLNIINKLLPALLIVIFINDSLDFFKVNIFEALGFFFVGIISFTYLIKNENIKILKPKSYEILNLLGKDFGIFYSRICLSFFIVGNIFMLGFLKGNIDVGEYTSADKLMIFFMGAVAILSKAMIPYQTDIYLNNNKKYNSKIYRIILFLIFGSLLFSLLGNFFAEILFTKILAIKSINSIKIFKVLIFSSIFLCSGPILTNNYIIKNRQKKFIQPFSELMIINFIVSFFLINKFGAIGLAYSTLLSWSYLIVRLIIIDLK